MGKVAWFLAVLSFAAAFIVIQSSNKKITLERVDKDRRLDELRASLDKSTTQGERVIRDLEDQCAAFENRGSAISQEQQKLASTRQEVAAGIQSAAQRIEQLEDKHETVTETKSRDLEEIQDLQADITLLETQVKKLLELFPLVKLNVEEL